MTIDPEFIAAENFNLKFKNYLRDFYIYQFKEKSKDIRIKGTKEDSSVNMTVPSGTLYPDIDRLRFVFEGVDDVSWQNGERVKGTVPRFVPDKTNKQVETIVVDSRTTCANPFFALYSYCTEPGSHVAFIYALLLYFRQGEGISLNRESPCDDECMQLADAGFKKWAEKLYNLDHGRTNKEWRELNAEQKKKYAKKSIQYFVDTYSKKVCDVACDIYNQNRKYRIVWDSINESDKAELLQKSFERFERGSYAERVFVAMVDHKKKVVYENGRFTLADTDFVEKDLLFFALRAQETFGERQFLNKLYELTALGILEVKTEGRRILYSLSRVCLDAILGSSPDLRRRFTDMVSFFSQTAALGAVGSYILERLPVKDDYMFFKHNYLKRALNDYNNIDLLYAIRHGLWVGLEYRNASMHDMEYQQIVCYPLELRESVTDGRQYLVYYYPFYRSVSALRVEFIDNITVGKLADTADCYPDVEKYFDGDIARARRLIAHTWGTSFSDFPQGNVKEECQLSTLRILMRYDMDREKYILRRIIRETRNRAEHRLLEHERFGSCIEVVAEVANTSEMLQWLRSYITRIIEVEENGAPYTLFYDEVRVGCEMYSGGDMPVTQPFVPGAKIRLNDPIDKMIKPADKMHTLLFNVVHGVVFSGLGRMLINIARHDHLTDEDIEREIKAYTDMFETECLTPAMHDKAMDDRRKQAVGFIHLFIAKRMGSPVPAYTLAPHFSLRSARDLLPLTSVEIQWLRGVLENRLARVFLSERECVSLLCSLPEPALFDINSVVLYDRFLDVDSFYKKPGFDTPIKRIIKAMNRGRNAVIEYTTQYGDVGTYVCSPAFIEYSKRDDRMRVRAVCRDGKALNFNIERIIGARAGADSVDPQAVRRMVRDSDALRKRQLVVLFGDAKNVPDRILTEFSPWEKKCVKWGDGRYRMTLYYDAADELEIVVRLLGYGPYIYVDDDDGGVKSEMVHRLGRQLELIQKITGEQRGQVRQQAF